MRWIGLLLILPLAAAGTQDAPDIGDPAGDSGELPCSPATDLRSFWAVWGDASLELHYTFEDLSALENAELQDASGSCFYSYNDLVIELGNATVVDSVYMDHSTNPAFEQGWRFYFHESGDDLEGTVDMEADHVRVDIPYTLIGTPADGDRVGDFLIQVVNTIEGAGLAYQGDWAPDDQDPCGCWVVYEDTSAPDPEPVVNTTQEPAPDNATQEPIADEDTPFPLVIALTALWVASRRR